MEIVVNQLDRPCFEQNFVLIFENEKYLIVFYQLKAFFIYFMNYYKNDFSDKTANFELKNKLLFTILEFASVLQSVHSFIRRNDILLAYELPKIYFEILDSFIAIFIEQDLFHRFHLNTKHYLEIAEPLDVIFTIFSSIFFFG